MKRILKETAKLAAGLVIGMLCVWFMLSFQWSSDEMSPGEKILGVLVLASALPLYWWIRELLD